MNRSGNDGPLLEVRDVSKRFPGVQALDGACLQLFRGEILAVVGENGAGKSTLMKVLAGIERPDAGTISLDGRSVEIRSIRQASDLGVALIHQELCLAENLSAGANIFLGREPRRLGVIDKVAIDASSRRVLARIGADFPPDVRVGTLSIGQRQSVEIAKALSQDAEILILDEPTSSLTLAETEHLFGVLTGLRAAGVGIVYISHRLGEVTELADRVTVLRDGKNAGELAKGEIDREAMVRLMVGRDVVLGSSRGPRDARELVLQVENLAVAAHPRERLGFEVRAGEVVGIAGLVGAGRTELLGALFGIERVLSGTVRVCGEEVDGAHPSRAIAAGIGLVPEDRKRHGLFLEMSLRANLGVATLREHGRFGFVDHARESSLAHDMLGKLAIKAFGPEQIAGVLSGGNQQKVVLAKWLATRPRLLLLDEPTRGIDVGARQEIYRLLDELAASGVAILFASSEMEEILALSDRVLVMHAGRIAGELQRGELSEEAVMRLATDDAGARSA